MRVWGQQRVQGEAAVFKACVATARTWGRKDYTAAFALLAMLLRPTACSAVVAVVSPCCHAAKDAELAFKCCGLGDGFVWQHA